ncbi:hypothetical protein BU23DRAFT_558475 [Bimuria novae-zelandiae CBS 107.79]|uniref:Uncharacterized protein n=1 Tax=Bimuria novae-zelandiae CBS 107.79 TaxID=1447943 RepID=A0A6A5UUE2_9PLEO|nr:hypothetical protein BU23DRAFT_558475 [Bimuria novae-zelandiae CBS 107.79]
MFNAYYPASKVIINNVYTELVRYLNNSIGKFSSSHSTLLLFLPLGLTSQSISGLNIPLPGIKETTVPETNDADPLLTVPDANNPVTSQGFLAATEPLRTHLSEDAQVTLLRKTAFMDDPSTGRFQIAEDVDAGVLNMNLKVQGLNEAILPRPRKEDVLRKIAEEVVLVGSARTEEGEA